MSSWAVHSRQLVSLHSLFNSQRNTPFEINGKKKERKKETHVAILLFAVLANRLLNLHIFHVVTRLKVQDTVQVQASLELTDHEVVIGVSLDTLDGEAAHPGIDLAGQQVRVGIASLEVERLLAVESKDLSRRHDVAPVEDGQAGVLVRDLRRLLPGEFDRVVHNVVHRKVPNTEDRRKDGTAESTAPSNGLVLVESEGEALAEELGDGVLDGRHTGATTNHFDEINVFGFQLGLGKRLLQRSSDSFKVRLNHYLQLLTLDDGLDVHIFHEGFNVHGGGRVGRQDLFHLLCGGEGTGPSLGVVTDVNLEVLLELIGEVLSQGQVEVPATKVTVIGSRLDAELTLAVLDDGSGVIGVTDVNDHDPSGLLVGVRKVELGDTVTKSGGGGVVDQSEHLEASDLTGIEHSPTLSIGEPGGNAEGDIRDGKSQLLGGDVSDLGQVHGNQLEAGELLLLAQVADFSTGLAIDVTQSSRVEALLNLNIGVAERTADESLEVAHRVLQVRCFLCLSSLTELSASGAESDQGPKRLKEFVLVITRKKKYCEGRLSIRSRSVGDFIGNLKCKREQSQRRFFRKQ